MFYVCSKHTTPGYTPIGIDVSGPFKLLENASAIFTTAWLRHHENGTTCDWEVRSFEDGPYGRCIVQPWSLTTRFNRYYVITEQWDPNNIDSPFVSTLYDRTSEVSDGTHEIVRCTKHDNISEATQGHLAHIGLCIGGISDKFPEDWIRSHGELLA